VGELSRGIELERFLIFRAPDVAGQQGFFPYRHFIRMTILIGKFPARWQRPHRLQGPRHRRTELSKMPSE
jgi:hypothetical protein